MTIIAALTLMPGSPEWEIGILALMFLGGAGIYGLLHWLFSGPRSADPWGDEVEKGLESDEALPLCHRCLHEHSPAVDFCPHCGATVGQYTNWLPYPYIFSLGDTLRLGTAGAFHRTVLTELGFILLAVAEYAVFAPFYWIFLFQPRSPRPSPLEPPPVGAG
jgi:hypothetical protein